MERTNLENSVDVKEFWENRGRVKFARELLDVIKKLNEEANK